MRIDFQLDKTFDRCYYKMEEFGVFNIYPILKQEIAELRKVINNSKIVPNTYCSDFFNIPIHLPFGNDYYYLFWNANLLEKFAIENKNLAVDLLLNNESIISDPSQLVSSRLKYYIENRTDKAIVLAYHLPTKQYIVIDGNHRYNAAKHRGDKSIKAIFLKPNQHIEFMLNDLSKNLYIVHHNLYLLVNLVKMPPFRKYNISKHLLHTNYYPLTKIDVKFNYLKNIPIYLRKIFNTSTI